MTSARLQAIEEIFHSVLAERSECRAAFLDRVCQVDPRLRVEVETLLQAHERATDFVETPATGLAAEVLAQTAPDLLIGRKIAHYELRERIGSGGMGDVYLAADVVAGRKAALKLLPIFFTADEERRRRFEQESRALVALNHPNIVTVYEIGEDGATHYIASELIEGETLRQRLARGSMPVEEALDVAIQVASAIAAAHAAGIVHRDIKPENIMLRPDGYVKVLDFGIATLAEQEAPAEMPQGDRAMLVEPRVSSIVGTARYMSPEQARGEPVGKATDIWSMGVVLYEMVAGEAPFRGQNAREVMASTLENESPLPTGCTSELQQIIAKAICKMPEERHESARALIEELRDLRRRMDAAIDSRKFPATASYGRWIRATVAIGLAMLLATLALLVYRQREVSRPPAPEKSIAVLPFQNLSKDPENAFFADGVQDEILSSLAKVSDLKVISRTSVMSYKGSSQRNLREIGQQLGVANVLEGSVQRTANLVRVNAQLIDARNDEHLWAQTYDGDLKDVFAIQSQIARAIADQLQARLSAGEKAAMAQPPTADLVANALYQQALPLEYKLPPHENLLEAIRLLDQAVARDPHFMLAYCALGRMHLTLYNRGYDHTPTRRELANEAIQNAGRIDPEAGEIHLEIGSYWFLGFRDYDRARAELDLARRKLPNNPKVYFLTGLMDHRQARWTEATRNLERAVELDPRDLESLLAAGGNYEGLHRYEEATRMFERAVAVSPHDYYARILRAQQPLGQHADIRPLRAELDAILAEEPDAAPKIAQMLFLCAIYERDRAATDRALAVIPAEGFSLGVADFVRPREWYVGYAARIFGDAESARTAFTAARAKLEQTLREQPDYAEGWSLLGRIDAALGRKEEAIREGQRGCELLPMAKDTWAGPKQVRDLAEIYAWTGEKDLAIEYLERAGRIPGPDYGELKLDPDWDPLRGDPRFEELVARMSPDAKGPAVGIPEKSIAVLPFENLSDDKQNAYFAAGVQDEILTDLAKVADLKVISRTSTRSYEPNKPRNLRQIGQQLGVANILEGSVQKIGHRVRINAQLIDARTDAHLWAQTYDRDVSDLFAVQSEIATTIAAQLRSEISGREKAAISRPPTHDPLANDLYHRALALEESLPSQSSLAKGVDLLQQALTRDPNFTLAYCALARVYSNYYRSGYDRTSARLALTRAALGNARRTNPESGEVHLAWASYLALVQRDYDHARAELELARRTLPNNPALYAQTGYIDRRQGRWSEAIINLDRAVELDPRNEEWLVNTASTYATMHRYAEAEALFQRALAISPRDVSARVGYAMVSFDERADLGRLNREFEALARENPSDLSFLADGPFHYALCSRDPAKAERAVALIPLDGLPMVELRVPRALYEAELASAFHRTETSVAAAESARSILEELTRRQPDNALAWSTLSRTYALLQRKEDAVKAGRHACELLPIAKEPTAGARPLKSLARTYAMVGEKDLAIEQLTAIVKRPMGFSYGDLKLAPAWDPLRGDPRFETIVAALAPRGN